MKSIIAASILATSVVTSAAALDPLEVFQRYSAGVSVSKLIAECGVTDKDCVDRQSKLFQMMISSVNAASLIINDEKMLPDKRQRFGMSVAMCIDAAMDKGGGIHDPIGMITCVDAQVAGMGDASSRIGEASTLVEGRPIEEPALVEEATKPPIVEAAATLIVTAAQAVALSPYDATSECQWFSASDRRACLNNVVQMRQEITRHLDAINALADGLEKVQRTREAQVCIRTFQSETVRRRSWMIRCVETAATRAFVPPIAKEKPVMKRPPAVETLPAASADARAANFRLQQGREAERRHGTERAAKRRTFTSDNVIGDCAVTTAFATAMLEGAGEWAGDHDERLRNCVRRNR